MLLLYHTFTPEDRVEQDGEMLQVPALHHWMLICTQEHGPKRQEAYAPLSLMDNDVRAALGTRNWDEWFDFWAGALRAELAKYCPHAAEKEYVVV